MVSGPGLGGTARPQGGASLLQLIPHCQQLLNRLCSVYKEFGKKKKLKFFCVCPTAFAMEGNTLPVAFVRYNPHAFQLDAILQRVSTSNRLDRLVKVVQERNSLLQEATL